MSGPTAPMPPTGPGLPLRVGLGLAGLGLLVGFFLPWIRLGDVLVLNGLGMTFTGGAAIDELSGPFRAVLLVVPLAGLGLIACAIYQLRALAIAGFVGGGLILLVGLFTLVRVFLDSTGYGMWLVVLSALAAIAMGFYASRSHS